MKVSKRVTIAALAVAGLIAATSAVALAATPVVSGGPAGSGPCSTQAAAAKANPTVDTLRGFGDCEIARRMVTLDKLSGRIGGSKTLTSSDASALANIVSSTKTGLSGLKSTIDAETDLTALKTDIRQIATQYRVYLLVVPQVNLVIGADTVQATQPVFDKINSTLSARIAAAKAAGRDTTAAEADLAAMNAAVSQALGLAAPLPARLLPLTPAQYNAGTAGPVLKSARASLVQARALLQSARKDAQACRDALR